MTTGWDEIGNDIRLENVMEIKWDPVLETGIEEIDDQHRKLLLIANALVEAVRTKGRQKEVQRLLDSLREYTMFHFRTEENWMEELGFPELKEHGEFHRDLTKKAKAYKYRAFRDRDLAPEEVLELLREWLLDHLLDKDVRFARFARESSGEKTGTRAPEADGGPIFQAGGGS